MKQIDYSPLVEPMTDADMRRRMRDSLAASSCSPPSDCWRPFPQPHEKAPSRIMRALMIIKGCGFRSWAKTVILNRKIKRYVANAESEVSE